MPMVETRNEVGAADDVFGVEEAESAIFEARNKLDAIQPFGFPASPMGFVDLKPANPKDVCFGLVHHRRSMENVESVDSKDLCICIRVNPILGEGHHMWSTLHIHLVLTPSEIVRRVVNIHAVPLFEAVVADVECVVVLRGERGWLGIILFVENASEEVILELCDKVLWSVSTKEKVGGGVACLQSWVAHVLSG